MERTFSFRLPNDLSEVPGVREHFEAACRAGGVVADELEAWKLVFTELVCNAIEHGCETPTDCVDISYAINATQLELRVTDPGEFAPELRHLFDRKTTNFTETGRGAGLILVREFTDKIDVVKVLGGTQICVTKYREREGEPA